MTSVLHYRTAGITKTYLFAAKNKSTPGITLYQYILCNKLYSSKATHKPGIGKTICFEPAKGWDQFYFVVGTLSFQEGEKENTKKTSREIFLMCTYGYCNQPIAFH